MAIPNMATVTASLERSLQNCSLNHQHSGSNSSRSSSASGGGEAVHGADSPLDSTTPTLELNSEAALPYHWEQCLDLKTGEIYYINWRTGMRSEEDPRRITSAYDGDYYSEEDDISSYDSEGSCARSSPCSREQWSGNSNNDNNNKNEEEEEEEENCYGHGHGGEEDEKGSGNSNNCGGGGGGVLVVAGCKGCFMYYMVPKQNQICPKCCGQLIHFDRSENASP